MATLTNRLTETQNAVLERMFAAQDRVVRTAADRLRKVPAVQRVGDRLHELALQQMFSRTSTFASGMTEGATSKAA
jgi:hypothetical protein